MYGTPPSIPGLVQTNITNSAEEKWALLDKDIEMEDSETENRNRNVLLSAQMGEKASVVLICIITSRYNEVK